MKALIASLVLTLSACFWVVGIWIIFYLGLVFLVEPPKHFVWRNVILLSCSWFAFGAIYWVLHHTDFWAGRSAIEKSRSELRRWLIQKHSKLVRILLGVGTACLLLRIVIDFFQFGSR